MSHLKKPLSFEIHKGEKRKEKKCTFQVNEL
jgi:hypothetical protein